MKVLLCCQLTTREIITEKRWEYFLLFFKLNKNDVFVPYVIQRRNDDDDDDNDDDLEEHGLVLF
jgi:hypothetical protein